jgi:hypothetical protein
VWGKGGEEPHDKFHLWQRSFKKDDVSSALLTKKREKKRKRKLKTEKCKKKRRERSFSSL